MSQKALLFALAFLLTHASHAQTLQQKLDSVKDSVTISASTKYGDPSFFKRIFLGKNYRNVWAQPVRLPVFHL